jgi:hypothetical protein
MERITYRKTLDVHKNGIQFLLQGFETADNMSRVIEISLMASGDAIDFPLERIEALMFVTTPNATEPSINKCTIKDNKVVYDVLPIVEEGITSMQLKIIETSPDGATAILATPKFAVEVTKSDTDDESVKQTTTFTALEDAVAKAKATYDARLLRIELTSDCLFRAYYAGEMPNEHGAIYETDILQKLFLNGNVLLSESFAHGGTGVRAGEDTDNSKYYSNVSKSEALNAKSIMENSEEILEKVRLHGTYTAFSVDFTTGEVEYVSPSYTFTVNKETGELEAEEQAYTFLDEIGVLTTRWLESQSIFLNELNETSGTHTTQIASLQGVSNTHTEEINTLKELKTRVTPIELGGTGAETLEGARSKLLGEWNLDKNVGSICVNEGNASWYIKDNENMFGAEYSFPIIHSGKVRLEYALHWGDTDDRYQTEKCSLTIYHNDDIVAERPFGGVKIAPELEVKDGDVIKFLIKVKRAKTGGDYVDLKNVTLYANIDTPYKYIDLMGTKKEQYIIEEE